MMDRGVQISNMSAFQASIEYVEYERDTYSVSLKFKANVNKELDSILGTWA